MKYIVTGTLRQPDTAVLSGASVTISSSSLSESTVTNQEGNYVFIVEAEKDYVVSATSADFVFDPARHTFTNLSANVRGDFSSMELLTTPILLSADDPTRALALDEVLRTPEPFRLTYEYPWSDDNRTRLVLFVTNIDLGTAGSNLDVVVEFEDSSGRVYPLTVEHAARVAGLESINRIIVRLNDNLTDVGDVLVRVTYKGLKSEPLRLGIGHVGP